jgi:hypothetical protein
MTGSRYRRNVQAYKRENDDFLKNIKSDFSPVLIAILLLIDYYFECLVNIVSFNRSMFDKHFLLFSSNKLFSTGIALYMILQKIVWDNTFSKQK